MILPLHVGKSPMLHATFSDAPRCVGRFNVEHRPILHVAFAFPLRRNLPETMQILSLRNGVLIFFLLCSSKCSFVIYWLSTAIQNKPFSCSRWTKVPQNKKKPARASWYAKSIYRCYWQQGERKQIRWPYPCGSSDTKTTLFHQISSLVRLVSHEKFVSLCCNQY